MTTSKNASTSTSTSTSSNDTKSMLTKPLLVDDAIQTDAVQPAAALNETRCFYSFMGFGALTGLLVQVVSLGAYAFLLTHWNSTTTTVGSAEDGVTTTTTTTTIVLSNQSDWALYGILSILTQIDMLVYAFIWMAFTCSMTKRGMALVQSQVEAPLHRRFVFVLGVYFLVGIVTGAFVAWTLIDMHLGFPIPFGPIVTTVAVDLVLCYLMVVCYDLGKDEDDDEDEDEEDMC